MLFVLGFGSDFMIGSLSVVISFSLNGSENNSPLNSRLTVYFAKKYRFYLDTMLLSCKSLVSTSFRRWRASIILFQPWNINFVHSPLGWKRNHNWIHSGKYTFLPSTHFLSPQKIKGRFTDGPSCGLRTGRFVGKIKIHLTFPSNN